MPKVFEVYNKAVNEGKEYGVLSHDLRVLLSHAQGYQEAVDVLLHKDDEVKDIFLFESGFALLKKGVPVEYIVNEASFLGRKLYVDGNVLIPRMETEELVSKISEKVSDYYDPRNYLVVADIGTGSGAIAIVLKQSFKNWLVNASDVSEKALKVAERNFKDNGVNIPTMLGPSLKPYIDAKMNLDIIVSNPPYIRNRDEVQTSVKEYEPASALYLDEANSVYEDIFRDYKKVKKGSLWMAFEIGYDLKDYLTDLMNRYLEDYEYEFVEDIDGMLRFLFVYCH